MKCTVIIPAYNEEKNISKVLESLQGQDCEIILVDDNSTDNTVGIAKNYGCKILKSGKHNISYSRNLGIEHASGDIIVSLDASEVTVPPNFIKEIKKNFHDCDSLRIPTIQVLDSLINQIGYYRTNYKQKYGPAIRIFKNKPEFRYDETIHFLGDVMAINNKFKRIKTCNNTYFIWVILRGWRHLFNRWRRYGNKKPMMPKPLFFGITSPFIMAHRLWKFRTWKCLLIPVFDWIRTLGYVVGLIERGFAK